MGINGKVKAERNKIVKIANARHSSNVRARGMLRKLMDQNKAAAQEEVAALAKSSYAALAKTLHITLNKASAHQEQVLAGMKKKLAYTQAASAGELRATKAMFKSRVNTLVN